MENNEYIKKLVSFLNDNTDIKNKFEQFADLFVSARSAYSDSRCGVCDKELDLQELQATSPFDFTFCCRDHVEYRGVLNITMLRRKLKIPEATGFIEYIKNQLSSV